jgi:hypothetical protein
MSNAATNSPLKVKYVRLSEVNRQKASAISQYGNDIPQE